MIVNGVSYGTPQQTNAGFSSFSSLDPSGSVGKTIVAYDSDFGVLALIVQPNGAQNGLTIGSIRNDLSSAGFNDALLFDGSSSATLVTGAGTVVKPAAWKNATINAGIGFKIPH
jgi:hypothetical protein